LLVPPVISTARIEGREKRIAKGGKQQSMGKGQEVNVNKV